LRIPSGEGACEAPPPTHDNDAEVEDETFDETLAMMIGTPNPDFVDSQEEFLPTARESSCEEFSEEEDTNYGYKDNFGIEKEGWPPEMLWPLYRNVKQRWRGGGSRMVGDEDGPSMQEGEDLLSPEIRDEDNWREGDNDARGEGKRQAEPDFLWAANSFDPGLHGLNLEHDGQQHNGPGLSQGGPHGLREEVVQIYPPGVNSTCGARPAQAPPRQYRQRFAFRAEPIILDSVESDLSSASDGEFFDDDGEGEDVNSIKHRFRDETWGKSNFTYDPEPNEFIGSSK
jgi:hypothetical protein